MTITSCLFLVCSEYFRRPKVISYQYNGKNFISKYNYKYLICLVLAFLPLFLVSGLRYDVGTDYYYVYTPHFYDIMNGDKGVFTEKTFILLNQIIYKFTDNSQWIFIITSFIYVLFMALAITKISNNYLISVLVLIFGGYFFSSMNNVRQNVAVAIICYAYYFVMNKKYIRFILLILLASCFHIVAIIALPALFILSLDKINNIRRKEFLYLGIIFAILLAWPLARLILANTKYSRYVQVENGNAVTNYIYLYGALFILLYIFGSQFNNNNKYYTSGMILLTITFALSLFSLLTKSTENTLRSTCYTNWSLIFLIPMLLNYKDKYFGITKYILVIVSLMIMLTSIYHFIWYSGCYEVFPYQSVFIKRH